MNNFLLPLEGPMKRIDKKETFLVNVTVQLPLAFNDGVKKRRGPKAILSQLMKRALKISILYKRKPTWWKYTVTKGAFYPSHMA